WHLPNHTLYRHSRESGNPVIASIGDGAEMLRRTGSPLPAFARTSFAGMTTVLVVRLVFLQLRGIGGKRSPDLAQRNPGARAALADVCSTLRKSARELRSTEHGGEEKCPARDG